MSDLVGFTILGGALFSLCFFVPLWGPTLVFRNVGRVSSEANRSYTLVDAFVLSLYLAVANSLVSLLRHEASVAWLIALAFFANAFAGLIWAKCQRFMVERGIRRRSTRLWVQVVIYPLSVFTVGLLLFSCLCLLEFISEPANYYLLVPATSFLIGITTVVGLRTWLRRLV